MSTRQPMSTSITGGCLCGAVTYQISNQFKRLFFCHCDQCRKLTGSAHVANLFTTPEGFSWSKGESMVKNFVHQTRGFSYAFCSQCGSSLPRINKSGNRLIVPAGSLDSEPEVEQAMHIFTEEQPQWSKSSISNVKHAKFPEDKS